MGEFLCAMHETCEVLMTLIIHPEPAVSHVVSRIRYNRPPTHAYVYYTRPRWWCQCMEHRDKGTSHGTSSEDSWLRQMRIRKAVTGYDTNWFLDIRLLFYLDISHRYRFYSVASPYILLFDSDPSPIASTVPAHTAPTQSQAEQVFLFFSEYSLFNCRVLPQSGH
mgnify:CR=1 FL=1